MFPGWPQHLPLAVGADSISARGGSRRRKVRRDEGIPHYGRPGGRSRSGLPRHFPWFVGEGHGPPAGPCGSAGSLGTMQASSPTEVCYKARFVIFRLAAGPLWFVGEGFIPPAGVCAAAGSGGMRASRPTVARVVEAAPVCRAFAMVRRGGPWPSRGTLRQCGVSGTMQASSPTLVCGIAGFVISRLASTFAVGRRGGFHIRPRGVAPPQGLRDDASIVPYRGLL